MEISKHLNRMQFTEVQSIKNDVHALVQIALIFSVETHMLRHMQMIKKSLMQQRHICISLMIKVSLVESLTRCAS